MTKFNYRPLPNGVTIGNSTIQGLGLFSTTLFSTNTILGISHHIVDYAIIRTPLGGFINHSDNPNVVDKDDYCCIADKNIALGEEITMNYKSLVPKEHWRPYFSNETI